MRGFSLVELSIVLVILGLLVGGILAGQSLIRGAEMRAIAAEYSQFSSAAMAFRDKYFAVPGDMTNATNIWGIAAGNGSDAMCSAYASTDAKTCNGNGDGWLGPSTGSLENLRVWQHLANAGLIPGQYTGTGASNIANVNAPGSRVDSSVWASGDAMSGNYFIGSTNDFAGNKGNWLRLRIYPSALPFLKPEEAWNIDTKLDDAAPATGRVVGYKGNATYPCTSVANQAVSAADTTATYNLSLSSNVCYLNFVRVF